ncbi:SDR family NAD(P)-dependent oxidoreductase [Thalassospira xiamenensis]|uniref:NAD(P)-dependent dehydrogenase, short-chain alcohol dehydrogenase family n=1 Tax=Thalassospira xiamenensis TaxID=220697 RepID=A0A285TWZ1_9PROT|nr:SDR family NAD(P)-dependent oxidoreductase [Thalassospira xiamenensis]SOC30037.1 NAD(P)-dependent dehydrogenase, short-chain alcohol dehydrogenase family [Thalassospira xiamenensis]
MGNLAIQTALITGGGTGVGAVMARMLADAGVTVAVSGRRAEMLAEVAKHSNITAIPADVTDEASVRAMFGTFCDVIGAPDLVIANAGMAESAPFGKTSIDLWKRTMDVNLTGTFLTFREGLNVMDRAKPGRLISIASTAGLKGYAYVTAYCAAKHAVIGLVKSLATELAATPITVNAVCPGFMETPMLEQSVANIVAKTGMSKEDARASLAKINPQNRLIAPEEVAETVMWLASKPAASITGQAISVSGGEI